MVGITGYGVHIPRYRLAGQAVGAAWGGPGGKTERAVANYDEDAVTMAWAALDSCLAGKSRGEVGGIYLASTSLPYLEMGNSALVASALDLARDIHSADFAGSLRAGASAFLSAVNGVKAGMAKSILVAASDLRQAEPGSPAELEVGDGAAGLGVGSEGVIAEVKDSISLTREIVDVWRREGEIYPHEEDARFIRENAILPLLKEAAEKLLKRTGLTKDKINKVVYTAPDARTAQNFQKSLGFPEASSLGGDLYQKIGNVGAALPVLLLIQALEVAQPGDRILWLAYGGGCDAFLLEVTDKIGSLPNRGVLSKTLEARRAISSYGKFLQFRGNLPAEKVNPYTSTIILNREESAIVRLHGVRCKNCGERYYPPRRICKKCRIKDSFEDWKIGQRGKVYTFTKDHLPPTPDPPVIMASADIEGGGRFYGQITDCDPAKVEIGMGVELTFRRIHEGSGFINYFWKMRPIG